MKYHGSNRIARTAVSHPSRGAWIEIRMAMTISVSVMESHPSRGAWIEIADCIAMLLSCCVAPLTGCVD